MAHQPDAIVPDNATHLKRVRQLGARRIPFISGQQLGFAPGSHLLVAKDKAGARLCWWDLAGESDAPRCTVEMPLEPAPAALAAGGDLVVGAGIPDPEAPEPWRQRLVGLSARDGAFQLQAPLSQPISALCASRDGSLLALLGGGRALLWDVKTWRVAHALEGMGPDFSSDACVFSPDGRLVAAAVSSSETLQGSVWLWDTATGARLGQLPIDTPFAWSVAFHPTRPLLVVGGNMDEVVVVDVESRRVARTLPGFGAGACNLDFSPDGALLVASRDGRGFGVHRSDTGELLFRAGDDNESQTSDALFSPDGRWIAWGQGDGTVGLWSVVP
ncbi:WD40 repeat domain-containing protein [Pyxidicoccus fallax]|uniref:WD40 repeat domain-containing protein n=1 Tax=Pyxidicoccus fallax TaxID=394095 RepID=A0A848LRJ9_9BACT|nr:WD40 repeat domain-containing protein [Pyxidicoccus fallax]NMO20260.1 WD40 repeat domain-containing protein [Pyxidicoccus fallax]NPC81018.1 WD40 repeat domain-containing protein [Pyxidicoccus fallax]